MWFQELLNKKRCGRIIEGGFGIAYETIGRSQQTPGFYDSEVDGFAVSNELRLAEPGRQD